MTQALLRLQSFLLVGMVLVLGGCTKLLGDFSYDENGGSGGRRGGVPAQGDIVVLPVTGLVTSESGSKATFTVVLAREPSSDVFIGLSSSNRAEGVVSPGTLTFTKDNYSAPQMVQVTGVDDDQEDGPQVYRIETTPATSADNSFLALDPLDPEITNTDNDTAGVTITPPGDIVTSEAGTEATFTMQLNHAPTADVTIPLSTDTPTEGTVSPALVTFTALNWMAPQTVTVTGVNDDAKDGERPYLVVTGNATSNDAKYSGMEVPDVTAKNLDNDTAGIVLSPQAGLVTFEPNLMTSLTIALSSPPTGDVVIGLATSDISEGKVSPGSVTFTPANWMAPQVISVTGEDDTRVDGDQPYQVLTSVISSQDSDYLTLATLPKADVINIDNDFARIVVDPMTELTTSEDLEAATFTVTLLSKPAGQVKVDVASNRLDEGVASPPLLTFTEENWSAPQTVTVMGVNDDVADGKQSYIVHVKPNPETADPAYRDLLEQDVMLSNVDNDSAGFRVTPTQRLTTNEGGGTATFNIELTSQPKANVTIALTSSDTTEGTVSPNQVVFTSDNYKSAQVVTVRGVNDDVYDGDQPYRIVTAVPVTDDPEYAKLDPPNVEVLNQDNDTAGITVEPKDKTLVTGENGQTATFTVRLNSQPKKDVVLGMASTETKEGTISPTSLRFTETNWRGAQTVTIKGQQDSVNDGDQAYRIRFDPVQSEDPDYGGDPQKLRPLDVKCSNVDDDSPFIRLTNFANLTTSEKPGSSPAQFRVALGSQPKANVTINVSSSRTGEGTVSPATLQFTPVNWSSPQAVTITGVDDKVQDGPQTFLVLFAPSTSQDGDYQGILPNPPNVSVANQDDDSAGILVKAATGLATSEPSEPATFTVELTSQPTADVTIPLVSSNTNEGTVSPASLTFTAANWNAPRTVTLTGVDDKVQDGHQDYFVSVGPSKSSDAKYNPKTAADVKVQNKDDDIAEVRVSAISGMTSEDGVTASFTISLQTQPTSDVKIGVSSTRVSEGTVSPSAVTFTQANWASPQKVIVTGVNDDMQDGDQPFRIDVAAATSMDANYRGKDAPDVDVTNLDNDTAEIVVKQISSRTSESGASATFSVELRTQPSSGATVSLTMASSNTAEAKLSSGSLTFTDANWKSPQVVTVTGVEDDSTADGDQPFTVSFGAAKSADPNYLGKQPLPLSFTNLDNDSPRIVVSPLTGETSEEAESMSFTVVLLSKPKADVKIPVASTDITEGTVSTSQLVFTSANWSAKQTVTVTGVNDDEHDGSPTYKVTLGKPTTTDSGYADIDPDDVTLTNIDDDIAGFVVSAAEGNTTEAGGKTQFSIRLRSQPKAPVTISLRTSDDTEGSLNPTVKSVVLTASDWNMPHWIDVFGEDDQEQDGDQPYTIITEVSSSADPDYDGVVVPDVSVKNLDNDTAGFIVGAANGHTNEAGGKATFTVVLKSKPTAGVSIPLSTNNAAEGTLAVESVEFTTGNWNVAQTVTVTGANDEVADGNVEYKIVLGKATSSDANYAGKDPDDVTLTNDDDDSAALLVTMPLVVSTGESASAAAVTFQVVLSSKPKANVIIALTSSNVLEGVVESPMNGRLTFTPSTWATEQTVTVRGVDDADMDGTANYVITVGPPESSDPGYNTLMAQTVSLQNLDDD